MNYMDQLMHREILACEDSAQLRLLQEVYRGREGCQRCVEG